MKCLKETAVLRCYECSFTKYLCGSCDQNLHEVFSFHDRDAIFNGHYQPIPPTSSKNSSGEWVTIGRQLPHLEIFCPACSAKCKPLVNQQEHHCIVVSFKDSMCTFLHLALKIDPCFMWSCYSVEVVKKLNGQFHCR